MLDSALRYRSAIVKITADADLGLRKYELTRDEWDTLKELQSVLKVCHVLSVSPRQLILINIQVLKHATTFFSKGTPNLAMVIPAMDLIDKKFATWLLESTFSAPVLAAITIAKKTLNRYYSLTDDADVYRLAMSMSHFFCLISRYSYFFDSSPSKAQAWLFP